MREIQLRQEGEAMKKQRKQQLKAIRSLWPIVQTTGGTSIDTGLVLKNLEKLNQRQVPV